MRMGEGERDREVCLKADKTSIQIVIDKERKRGSRSLTE